LFSREFSERLSLHCGYAMQLYNFGRTVSIPFFEENWRPTSFYEKIQYNKDGGMHTLCLLDIKVKEPDFEAMARGKTVFMPPRYMSVNTAAEHLIESEEEYKKGICSPDCLAVGLARLGQPDQCIFAGTLQELTNQNFGAPLHSLIICGEVHDLELEMLNQFMIPNTQYKPNTEPQEGIST
jgi:diphthine synthase